MIKNLPLIRIFIFSTNNPMKNIFKTLTILLILSSLTLQDFGQRRAPKSAPSQPAVPALDSSKVMNMIAGQGLYYNVRHFGAKGDSVTLDTDAINKAVEAAASAGGGTVYFPAGDYLSFSIRLKSNITLFLDNGAYLIGAVPREGEPGYDPPEPNPTDMYQDFGHSHWHNPDMGRKYRKHCYRRTWLDSGNQRSHQVGEDDSRAW